MCGQRWIRTTEGESQQIYSLPHLATLVFAHRSFAGAKVLIYFYSAKQIGNYFGDNAIVCRKKLEINFFYGCLFLFCCLFIGFVAMVLVG